MDPKRLDLAKQVFKFLDEKRSGSIPLADLLKKFSPEIHPRVQAREKTAEQICKELEEGLARKAYAFPYLP